MEVNMFKKAFTLAEVLITLAIIGVVAAMTIPTLISNYKKHEVETKLVKFYSVINEAVKLSEIDNGEMVHWDRFMDQEAFYHKYLEKYLKVAKAEPMTSLMYAVYFQDGTGMVLYRPSETSSLHMQFYLNAKDILTDNLTNGKDFFVFYFYNDKGENLSYGTYLCNSPHLNSGLGFQPYIYYAANTTYDHEKKCQRVIVPATSDEWKDAMMNDSFNGCASNGANKGAFCTELIRRNGWKIPDDYPYRF